MQSSRFSAALGGQQEGQHCVGLRGALPPARAAQTFGGPAVQSLLCVTSQQVPEADLHSPFRSHILSLPLPPRLGIRC